MQLDEVGVPENLMPKTFPWISTKDDDIVLFPAFRNQMWFLFASQARILRFRLPCWPIEEILLGSLQATYSSNIVLNGGKDPIIVLLLCLIVSDLPQNLGWPQIVCPVLKVTLSWSWYFL